MITCNICYLILILELDEYKFLNNNNNNLFRKINIKILSIKFRLTFLKPFLVALNKAIIGQESFDFFHYSVHQCNGQLC